MLTRYKKNLTHSILFLILVFWLTTLTTLIFFYLRLKSQIKPLTQLKTIKKNQMVTQNSQPYSEPDISPSPSITPTAIPVFPDKITFDPDYGDTINIALPIEKYNSVNKTLTIKVNNKEHTYKINQQTKINLIKNNKPVVLSLDEAEKILLKPTTKVMLGSNRQKVLEILMLFSD